MISPAVHAADGLPLTVPALLRRQAAARPRHPLLACDGERLTYAEADRRSAALATGLLAAGAGKGTHIGILYPNGPDFVVGYQGAAETCQAPAVGSATVRISPYPATDDWFVEIPCSRIP